MLHVGHICDPNCLPLQEQNSKDLDVEEINSENLRTPICDLTCKSEFRVVKLNVEVKEMTNKRVK